MRTLVLIVLWLAAVLVVGIYADSKVVCYYYSPASYRSGNGACDVDDLDASTCTHLVYMAAGLDYSTKTIKSLDPWNDLEEPSGRGSFRRFVNKKTQNPLLKCLLSIGGWNESPSKYSEMASTAQSRKTFIDSAVAMLQKYNFDGLDLDWEYPTLTDKTNYGSLINEMRAEFLKHGYSLSASISPLKSRIDDGLDIPSLNTLDFITVMTHDYHGEGDSVVANPAPLYPRSDESGAARYNNIESTMTQLVNLGATPSNLIVEIAGYGRTFTLTNPAQTNYHAATNGVGTAGQYTIQAGLLGFNEFCESHKASPWTLRFDSESQSPYAFRENQWIGYDNVDSVKNKTEWALSKGFGGCAIRSIDTDDVHNACGNGKFPLTKTIYSTVFKGSPAPSPSSSPSPSPSPSTSPSPSPSSGDSCNSSNFGRTADCKYFFQCDADGTVDPYQSCPPGLVFNLNGNYCDYPSNVPECL